jgi:PAS domain S-box-containing protein
MPKYRLYEIARSLPLLVLALSLVATFGAWCAFTNESRLTAQGSYKRKTSRIVALIADRLNDHEQLLLGGVGLFNAKSNVTREDWHTYVQTINPRLNLPDVIAIGYAAWTGPDAHHPASASVRFLEPQDPERAKLIGYNLYSGSGRPAAIERARDTGETTVAAWISLPGASRHEPNGFLILAPVYRHGPQLDNVESRRAQFQGLVYAPVRMTDLIRGSLTHIPEDVAFEIFDGDAPVSAKRVYSSLEDNGEAGLQDYHPMFSSAETVAAYGRNWRLTFQTLPPFDREFNRSDSSGVLWGGIGVSVLLCLLVWNSMSRANAIAESESRFRNMADSAPVLIWVSDPCGFCIWVNQAWVDFTGRPLVRNLGRGWMEAVHPQDLKHRIHEGLWCMGDRTPFTNEFRVRRSDGEFRTVLTTGVPRFREDGVFEGYIGSCVDISEMRQAHETVRSAEEFTRATIDALDAHIRVLDEGGTILAVNRRWRDFAIANGLAPADFGIGCNYLDVCDAAADSDAEGAQEIAAGIRSVLNREIDSYSHEYPCHSPSERRFFNVRVTRFGGSGPARIVVAHENTTRRKLAEEALIEGEQQLKTAQRMAHVGSWTRNLDTGRALWSEEMYHIFGYDPVRPPITYADLSKHYTPESFARLERAASHAVLTGEPFNLELEIMLPDGTHRHCMARGEPITSEDGQVHGFRGTLHDVTELHALNRELQKSHHLLSGLTRQIPGFLFQYRETPDGRGCFLYASNGVKDLYEVTPAEVVADASKIFGTIHADDLAGVIESLRESGRTLSPWKHENRVILPRQGLRWREGSAQPQLFEDGSIVWHGYVTDITERKQLEEELKLARFTVDSIDDAVHWILPDGRFWNVNAAACRMLDYTYEEITRLSIFDIDPAVATKSWPNLWEELKKCGTYRFRSTMRQRGGREIPVEVTAHYLNFNGLEYDWAVVRDITEQVRNELAEERRQRAILDNLPMLAWLRDADGRFEMVNEAFAEYCRRPVQEITGKTASEVMPADGAKYCSEISDQVLAARRQARTEVAFVDRARQDVAFCAGDALV